MAGNSAFSFILQLSVIILAISLNNNIVIRGMKVGAQLLVEPLWDMLTNASNPCSVNIYSTEGLIQLRGSETHSCNLQVTATQETHIQLLIPGRNASQKFAFVYIERTDLEHCSNKYFAYREEVDTCTSVLLSRNIQITLQGSTSIYIIAIPESETLSICPEYVNSVHSNKSVSQPDCKDVRGYNDKITCDPKDDRCRLKFPTNCSVTLGYNEIVYENCNSDLSQHPAAIIIYPKNITILDLANNNIANINANSFHSIDSLQVLVLSHNYLSTLHDEMFLGLQTLTRLHLSFNNLELLEDRCFAGLDELRHLYLWVNKLKTLSANLFQNLINLEILYLDVNKIALLDAKLFIKLSKLTHLGLSSNMLSVLPRSVFKGLNELKHLFLYDNKIKDLPVGLFQNNKNLIQLDIYFNSIVSINRTTDPRKKLDKNLFQGLKSLSMLSLAYNAITYLDRDIFKDTISLRFIDLSSNRLIEIPNIKHLINLYHLNIVGNTFIFVFHDAFSALSEGSEVFTNQHEICECYVPKYVNCSAADKRSPYLTCDRLLSNTALVIVMWLIGLNALCGNIFVFLWQKRHTRPNKVFTLLLYNLAASDFLMGIYMFIITSADLYFGNNFPMQSEAWRSGITCRIAGALSIISSEASVFFVTIISIDRFISITFPFSTKRIGKRLAGVIAIFTWIFSFLLGSIPSGLSGVKFKFYDNSHVCIGLPLTLTKTYKTNNIFNLKLVDVDGYLQMPYFQDTFITRYDSSTHGLFFSTAIFLGLNSICYLIILGCYIEIVRAVRKSSKRAGRSHEMQQQIKLTTKVTAIVATDFCCWFPVIILGILVQLRVITLPPSVYAWCVTFVLPINSAINPYLYTITEIVSEKRRKRKEVNDNKNLKEVFQLQKQTTPETSDVGQFTKVTDNAGSISTIFRNV